MTNDKSLRAACHASFISIRVFHRHMVQTAYEFRARILWVANKQTLATS